MRCSKQIQCFACTSSFALFIKLSLSQSPRFLRFTLPDSFLHCSDGEQMSGYVVLSYLLGFTLYKPQKFYKWLQMAHGHLTNALIYTSHSDMQGLNTKENGHSIQVPELLLTCISTCHLKCHLFFAWHSKWMHGKSELLKTWKKKKIIIHMRQSTSSLPQQQHATL